MPSFSACRARARSFFLALGFLTRLGPAMSANRDELTAATRWFPLVGAVLGLALTLPLLLGAFSTHPLAAGWFYVFFSAFLTRGLHYDGLADLADALGSGKNNDEFWAVVKDSRLGAFGCLALILAVGGLAALASALLDSPGPAGASKYGPFILAPTLGRCLPALLAWRTPVRPASSDRGLGGLLAPEPQGNAAPTPVVPLAVAVIGPLVCLPFFRAALCWLLCLAVFQVLARLARRQGGFNGDFLGAAIVLGELAVFVAACI